DPGTLADDDPCREIQCWKDDPLADVITLCGIIEMSVPEFCLQGFDFLREPIFNKDAGQSFGIERLFFFQQQVSKSFDISLTNPEIAHPMVSWYQESCASSFLIIRFHRRKLDC